MRGRPRDPRRIGRIERVGIWLRLWAPPRDVPVPPPPSRATLLAAAAAVALVAAVGAGVVAPRLESAKRDRADAEERVLEARRAERVAAMRAAQRPRHGALARIGPAPATRAAVVALRRRVVARVERDITRDVRRRVRAGELPHPARRTECEPFPRSVRGVGAESDPAVRFGLYSCVAVTSDIPARAGAIGYAFRARVDFRSLSWAWCRIFPVPGERVVPRPDRVVRPPRACSG